MIRALSLLTIAFVVLPGAAALAQEIHQGPHFETESPYPERPGDEFVWEEGCVRPDGEIVEGFWRENEVEGFVWQEAGWAEDDSWVDYDYLPDEEAPGGYAWEPGFRGDDGVWQLGYWRELDRQGYAWSEGTYLEGDYVGAQWEPDEMDEEEYSYEPGYRADNGYWISGFQRRHQRAGHNWIPRAWHDGQYATGYWKPARMRQNHVWV
jgi:hypothetical protein